MIKDTIKRRDFVARNHTVLTGFRHRQTHATLIKTNQRDQLIFVQKNIVIYIHNKKARLNYFYGKQGLPYMEVNLAKFNDKTKARDL